MRNVNARDAFWSQLYVKGRDYRAVTGTEVDRYLDNAEGHQGDALDIGCGTGQLTRELYHRGFAVTGVDISAVAIEIARSRTIHKITYLHQDIENDHLGNVSKKKYQLITCRLTFAFVRNKIKFLRVISNLLADNGAFIIVTPLLDRVLPEKRKTAVDLTATEQLLKQFFSVKTKDMDGLGFIVCHHK